MKKILSTLLLLLSFAIQAQNTGIGTTNPKPSAGLEIKFDDKALLVTRVQSPMMIANPVNGMIIYDNSAKCFRVYQGGLDEQNGAWSNCYGVPNPPIAPIVNGLGCSNTTTSPSSALYNVSYNGTIILPYYQGNGAAYPTQLVVSTGVTGLTAQLLPGTLNNESDGNLYFTVSGTPAGTGNANFAFTFGGKVCTFSIPVNYPAAVAFIDCNNKTLNGTLTAGTAVSSVSVSVPYTSGNGGYYNTISISSVGVAGLTATAPAGYVNNGNGNLVLNISGTPNTAGNAIFNLNFAGTSCQLTIPVDPGGPQIANFNCGTTTYTPGNIFAGTAYSGTATVPYTGGNGQAYTAGGGVPSTGVIGLTATLQAGTLTNGNLIYTISGTPNAAGTATFNLSFGGKSCTLTANVLSTPATLPAGTGTFSGKTCFDIAQSNDNVSGCGSLISRLSQKADFTQAATHTQSYIFTPSGTVSNVRFMYVNTNGNVVTAISGNNTGNNISTPVTAIVNYNTNLNTLALGLTNINQLTVDIYVVYNDNANNTGAERQIKLTAEVKDCSCCGAYVAPGVWKNFMCHNLGADQTADPLNPSWKLNGSYIQWGKRGPTSDWQTAPNNGPLGFAAAPTDGTATGANYVGVSSWSSSFAGADNSWNSGTEAAPIKTANDPCPTGYRVPTYTELYNLYPNNTKSYVGTWSNGITNYSSGLRLNDRLLFPAVGYRIYQDGSLSKRGYEGYYWSSRGGSYIGYGFYIGNNVTNNTYYSFMASDGFAIRCIVE